MSIDRSKTLRYATYLMGLISMAAVLCFLVYASKYSADAPALHNLNEEIAKATVELEQKTHDDATRAAESLVSASVSKNGAELALLSFIALNVAYYVHFRK